MINNSAKIMFLNILMMGTLISTSANSWLGAWMGLEINLLAFIPLMSDNKLMSTEASLKYFLTQALASSMFLFAVIMLMMNFSKETNYFTEIIFSSLLLKSGSAPFHFWFPNVMEGLSWTMAMAMGLILLIQTTLICLMSGLMTKSFWFSYILFLVFLGGMLVLFIYVTSLASNEMFSFSIKLTLISITMFMLMMITLFFIDKNILLQYMNSEMKSISNMNSYIMENSLSLNKLYNYPMNLLTILLMNYLLITLIAVVKISNLSKGPLRPMYN